MSIQKGSVVLRDKLGDKYYGVKETSDRTHASISQSFSTANNFYNQSSVLEDVVLNKYLSMINTTSAIGPNGFLNSGMIIESFTSQDYVDNNFPVDDKLNIDTQNGHLTLPVISTRDLTISDVIFETGSNGELGNAYEGYKNNKAEAMIDGSNSTMLEYEKYSNLFTETTLTLSMTLRLNREEVANGVYIKTHVIKDLKYPVIEEVQISLDGESWEDALNIIDINKGDHYIRFIPKNIRFVRIKMSQNTFYSIRTLFGLRRRYMIGVRAVTLKQSIYKPQGEYISIPFSGKKTINRVAFSSSEVDNKDISYSISANNGSSFVPISSGETKTLDNYDFGLHGDINIKDIRVKVKMDRNQSPGTKEKTERMPINSSSKYTLENTPIDISTYIGKHVSYGGEKLYNIDLAGIDEVDLSMIEDFSCPAESLKNIVTLHWIPYYDGIINDLVIRFNGMLIKNDGTIYNIIASPNGHHSVLILYKDYLPSGTISLSYNPYLHSHSTEESSVVNLPQPLFIKNKGAIVVEAIVYNDYENIINPAASDNNNDIINAVDGDPLTFWRADTKVGADVDLSTAWVITFDLAEATNLKMYSITPEAIDDGDDSYIYKYSPSAWSLYGSNDGSTWVRIDSRTVNKDSWNGAPKDFLLESPCKYENYMLVINNNSEAVDASDTLAIKSIGLYTSTNETLNPATDYDVIDRNTIEIAQAKYSPDWDYKISYLPGVQVDEYVNITEGSREVSTDNIAEISYDNDIAFDYTHQDESTIQNVKYYTPISKEYRVEML